MTCIHRWTGTFTSTGKQIKSECSECGAVVDLEDHIAFACDCGSVQFNLLKSGRIECAGCGIRFGEWKK